jgi:hypothetical protein
MNKLLRPKGLNDLDVEIERLVAALSAMHPTDDDYDTISSRLKTLCEARSLKNDSSISSEAVLNIVANVLGMLLVLNFERTGVITSKAFGFLGRK